MTWECNEHGEFPASKLVAGDVMDGGTIQCPVCNRIMENLRDEDRSTIPGVTPPDSPTHADRDSLTFRLKRQVLYPIYQRLFG